jgi:hypothetical protein
VEDRGRGWPDAAHTLDPEAMHPRAVEMAQAMREGVADFRGLQGAGFSAAEIRRFAEDARALATTLSSRQAAPGGDLLSEMVDKAVAAIANQPPLPRGTAHTQALAVGWAAYCRAIAAHRLDPHDLQRERCLDLLEAWFSRHTAALPGIAHYVAEAVRKTLDGKARR